MKSWSRLSKSNWPRLFRFECFQESEWNPLSFRYPHICFVKGLEIVLLFFVFVIFNVKEKKKRLSKVFFPQQQPCRKNPKQSFTLRLLFGLVHLGAKIKWNIRKKRCACDHEILNYFDCGHMRTMCHTICHR